MAQTESNQRNPNEDRPSVPPQTEAGRAESAKCEAGPDRRIEPPRKEKDYAGGESSDQPKKPAVGLLRQFRAQARPQACAKVPQCVARRNSPLRDCIDAHITGLPDAL
jgi:hypothetical protein